ncbi:transmembrane protein 229B-like [Hemicordylus capensis]|uniref:transmembrane protein 229B-like n=1 Tax=Hemicordylus capensis TaxID=884348 RepID=UPI002303729B|nr:transmembrane protein 229B-like [Hemicordylus capensis]XP_053124511.1 transmembrane protein 229B-like [Hemicordylus capensis]
MGSSTTPLSPLCRWYIYAIHGYFTEVMFTAAWDFMEDQDWRFRGVTSVWAFFIYGTCGFILERIYLQQREKWCLLTRCLVYTLCIYLWEFSTGSVLRLFGACPWDYSGFRYHLLGLVTLEYGLFWFVGSLLLEKLVICNALRLRLEEAAWKPEDNLFPRFALKDD